MKIFYIAVILFDVLSQFNWLSLIVCTFHTVLNEGFSLDSKSKLPDQHKKLRIFPTDCPKGYKHDQNGRCRELFAIRDPK